MNWLFINMNKKIKHVGLSRATLEFQVSKISSITEIPKLDPCVTKIVSKNWVNFDLICPEFIYPNFIRLSLTLA